ncbi:hypothetical protein JQ617_29225 [Bradyrhizobium sp. KB893862 SZCCT0404]|uniref:hypothetical protein n=1 Tax=Bradyrhizobium sp. KB893862 SZCCT0404 TaxID=2807672 RepID=UPI001BA61730|nr:hypothetical protein [Bradyrhizobium sp. KB893862 SZCCT0404]MBR1178074.1 hypothetical protein [Bradyrhizobium sp. KB893862 SZCCT0404]
MRTHARNIIGRLRGLFRNDEHEAAAEPGFADATPAMEEAAADVPPVPTHRTTLTPSGTLFNRIRFDSPELAEMRSKMPPRSRVEFRMADPSDASSILVWDSSAQPAARWITVPAAEPIKTSPSKRAAVADHANDVPFAFATDAERADAAQAIRRQWEKLAAKASEHSLLARAGDSIETAEKPARKRKPTKPALLAPKRAKRPEAAAARTKVATRVSRAKRK